MKYLRAQSGTLLMLVLLLHVEGVCAAESALETEKAQMKYYEERENREQLGRKGFWLGVGGLLAGAMFDKFNMTAYRTASYSIWGLGWTAWMGSLSESINIDEKVRANELPRSSRHPYQSASLQGAIGEASNLHLIPDGIYFHPLYNDVNGGTDKLLTGSAKLGWLQSFEEFSIESVLYWRLLTPAYISQFGAAELPEPVGRFADWNQWKTAISRETPIMGAKLRHQVSIGYSDIGDKGGKEFHQSIHRVTRNSMDHLEYVNQPEGRFFTIGAESGVEAQLCIADVPCFESLVSLQGEQSRMMSELGGQWNLKMIVVPKWWEQALEVRVVKQIQSDVYDQIMPWRYEGAVGVRIFSVFAPTLKYISPYLYGDGVGQTYFDLIHYNYAF